MDCAVHLVFPPGATPGTVCACAAEFGTGLVHSGDGVGCCWVVSVVTPCSQLGLECPLQCRFTGWVWVQQSQARGRLGRVDSQHLLESMWDVGQVSWAPQRGAAWARSLEGPGVLL